MKKIKIIEAGFIALFALVLYFLLPHLLPVFGVKSFLVTTGSMIHHDQASFESFCREMGMEPRDTPFRYGFGRGDLLIVVPSEKYGLGDVVAMRRSPKDEIVLMHRILEYNSTHFRDVGDRCIDEEGLRPATLGVKGKAILLVTDPEGMLYEPDELYEGRAYEVCGHYWMPVSIIEGKAVASLPGAGLLHMLFEGPRDEEPPT